MIGADITPREQDELSVDASEGNQDSIALDKHANELTVRELEMLLEDKRRALGQERLKRISDEEVRDGGAGVGPSRLPSAVAHAPASLTGQEARERFGPWRLEPLATDPIERASSFVRRHGAWRDHLLLALEVLALGCLIMVVYMSFSTLQALEVEVPPATYTPKPTAIPTVVPTLPGSAVPPGESHLPPFYMGLVEPPKLIPLATPTLGPQAAIRIVIDAIDVDARVVEGDDWESLKKGVGHHLGSANPGQRGNVVVSAHDDVFGEIFRYLDQLEAGDEVWVYTQANGYRYIVREVSIVEPTEVSVMEPTDEPVLTMITCYPYGIDSHRVVVVADLAP